MQLFLCAAPISSCFSWAGTTNSLVTLTGNRAWLFPSLSPHQNVIQTEKWDCWNFSTPFFLVLISPHNSYTHTWKVFPLLCKNRFCHLCCVFKYNRLLAHCTYLGRRRKKLDAQGGRGCKGYSLSCSLMLSDVWKYVKSQLVKIQIGCDSFKKKLSEKYTPRL